MAEHVSPMPSMPAAPRPSMDAGMVVELDDHHIDSKRLLDQEDMDVDIFRLSSLTALKLLTRSVTDLISIADAERPPTPPASDPIALQLASKDTEDVAMKGNTVKQPENHDPSHAIPETHSIDLPGDVNGNPSKTPIGSPEAHPTSSPGPPYEPRPPLHPQDLTLARTFNSKRPPPIPLSVYLLRLHKYLTMSPAVYLATAVYLSRLALVDHLVPVTRRNAHRLVLAGLRVAMKALEDRSYPHKRFADVGGVTERELVRLELSFCFLMGFDLWVDESMLSGQVMTMRSDAAVWKWEREKSRHCPALLALGTPILCQEKEELKNGELAAVVV